ncbi:hypothetical protein ACFL07_02205, partial [Pseudomonadota bacterium]
GGTAQPEDWTLTATGYNPQNPQAGIYALSESGGPEGYEQTSLTCDNVVGPVTEVTLNPGENVTCTFVNDDIAPTLTIIKNVMNDDGGSAGATDFGIGTDAGELNFDSGKGTNPTVYTAATLMINANNAEKSEYSLFESDLPGYIEGRWSCSNGDGGDYNAAVVTLLPGEEVTCEITNDDVAPGLSIVKRVVNENGGTAVLADFNIATDAGTLVFDQGVTNGQTTTYTAQTLTDIIPNQSYSLSESGAPGYIAGDWICSNGNGGTYDNATVAVSLGDTVICEIVNDDIAPKLTLNKIIVNDNGGTALESDWILRAEGPTPIEGAGGPSSSDVQSTDIFSAGTYTLSESGPGGYRASAWSCDGGTQDGNQITLDLDQTAICTITNDDLNMGPLIFSDGFESD